MRVVFMGTPQFAVYSLEALADSGYDIAGVYTQPDKAVGRGRIIQETPVKKAGKRLNLSILQPDNLKTESEIMRLSGLKPDVIVVAAYGQILRKEVLDIPPFGCINIHPSLLPRYRGVAPVPAAILNGDEFTGVSVMLLDRGVDTGPVLTRAQIPVSSVDDTALLSEKLSIVGAQLLLDTLPRWFRKEIVPQKQDDSQASYTRMMAREDGEIDWNLSAVQLWRRIRAFQPWPGCFTGWQGRQLKIIEAVPLDGGDGQPGAVVALKHKNAGFGVVTGSGVLGVVKVQMEGKKVMDSGEFIRGQRQFIGTVLS